MATSNRLRDLKKALAEKDNFSKTEKTAPCEILNLINNWIQRNYSELVEHICYNFKVVRKGGECAFDILNDCILQMYYNSSLQFKNQSECDEFLEKELKGSRFIVRMKDVKYD